MNFSFVLGNLLGRVLLSYALVLLVCWVFSRGQGRLALRRSGHWASWVAVLMLSVLGMAGALHRQGGLS